MTAIHPKRYDDLGGILEDAFLTYPSDTATIEVDRHRETRRLSYAAFRLEAHRIAAFLASRGLTRGARVAVLMNNQTAWLLTAVAAYHNGCVVVPLDARAEAPEQDALLRHCGAQALFVDAHIHRKLTHRPEHTVVTGLSGPTPGGALRFEDVAATEGPAPRVPRQRSDIAAIVYSSGTGGDPKGCMLTHGNYLSQYEALTETFEWRRGDRYFSILPTNHAIDFMCGFIASFCTGTTVVHQRTLRPEFLLDTMRRYRVTQMAVVPLLLKAFERAIRERLEEAPDDRQRLFGALTRLNATLTRRAPNHGLSRWLVKPIHDAFGGQLRILYCGGAFTERARAEFFAELGLPVAIGYGLTEATTVVTVNDLRPFRGDTVGTAVPGVQIRIADPDAHGVGEVQVRGPTVFAGYLDDPEQTAASFDGDWLKTGDLGWLDGAFHLHLVGRRKNMIVTAGGKNVYPEDVEACFEDVDTDDLCLVAEDYVWPRQGLGQERLVAVVRSTRPRDQVRRELADRNRRLPEHKRVGALLWWDEPFPRTTSMKLKRAELARTLGAARQRDDLEHLT